MGWYFLPEDLELQLNVGCGYAFDLGMKTVEVEDSWTKQCCPDCHRGPEQTEIACTPEKPNCCNHGC